MKLTVSDRIFATKTPAVTQHAATYSEVEFVKLQLSGKALISKPKTTSALS